MSEIRNHMSNKGHIEKLNESESGTVLVLLALLIFVILGFYALIIDIGNIAMSRQQLSYAADHAALRALESFHEQPTSAAYGARVNSAAAAASQIFSANKLLGTGSLGTLGTDPSVPLSAGPGTSGYITPGAWVTVSGTPYGNCPNGNYPCFKPNPSGTTTVTAMQVTAFTPSTNPIRTIFANLFGFSDYQSTTVSTSTLKGRCVQVMIDVSASIIQRYHGRITYPPLPNGFAVTGGGTGDMQFAFRTQDWQGPLASPPNPSQYISAEHQQFVNGVHHSPRGGDTSKVDFYEDDFTLYPGTINGQNYYVYSRNVPGEFLVEPLYSVLLGLNVAAQAMNERAVAGDAMGVMAFDDEVPGPTASWRRIGLTNNFGFITQVTDINNFYSGTYPNFVDMGFFPREKAQSNYDWAIKRGRQDLNSFCAVGTDKVLIIIGDGISNCQPWTCGTAPNCNYGGGCTLLPPRTPCSGTGCYGCNNSYDCNYDATYALIYNTNITDLKNDQIAFHFIHVGDAAGPNTLNCPNPQYWNCRVAGGSDATCAAQFTPFLDDTTWRNMKRNNIPFPTTTLAGAGPYPANCANSFVQGNNPQGQSAATQFANMSSHNPYLSSASWIYNDYTKTLGGVYCPIRRPPELDISTGTNHNCLFDGTPATAACDCVADVSSPSGKRLRNSHYLPADLEPSCGYWSNCTGNCCNTNIKKTRLAGGPQYTLPDYLGTALRVDPFCQTAGEQVSSCAQKILAGDPFKLVDVNP